MPKQKDMKQELMECCHPHQHQANGGGAVYGLGVIGALVYFIQHAANATDILMGIVKAIVWPALLVFKALLLLKM